MNGCWAVCGHAVRMKRIIYIDNRHCTTWFKCLRFWALSDDDHNFRSNWITVRNKLNFCVFTAQPLCAYFPGAVLSSNHFSNIKAHLCCISVVYAAGEAFTCKTAHLQHTEKKREKKSLSTVLLPYYTVKVPIIFLDIDGVFCSVKLNCSCLWRTLLDR